MVECNIMGITGTKFRTTASEEDTVVDLLRRIDEADTTGNVVNLFNSRESYEAFSLGDDGAIDTATSSFALTDAGETLKDLNYKDTLGQQIGAEMVKAERNGDILTFLASAAMVVGSY